MTEVSLLGVFLAGLASFVTPCVLPIVPPYLCYLAGVSFEELERGGGAEAAAARRVFWRALAFVLGFATVFVALGLSASAIGKALAEHFPLLARIAGAILILFGLHFLGVLRIALFYREARWQARARPLTFAGAYVVGLAFAFGWTPCVGPVLSAVLLVAGAQETIWRGGALLAVYALGIGVPFLIAAAAARPFLAWAKRFRRHLRRVEQVMGALLILTGLVFVLGWIPDIAQWLLETFPALGRIG